MTQLINIKINININININIIINININQRETSGTVRLDERPVRGILQIFT